MFCKKCLSDLSLMQGGRCAKCGRPFDCDHPRTYLARPFPRWPTLVGQFVLTTICAVVVAYAVAFHQAARTSGH